MEAFLFYTFSGLAICGASLVIFMSRPTRALLSLIVMMTALSVLYVQLGAHFVAIAQIIVYAGAVLVLFLFVIMLQGIQAKDIPFRKRFHTGWIAAFIMTALLLLIFMIQIFQSASLPVRQGINGTVENVGRSLFTHSLLPFELTAILLLLSVFAAVALAKKEEEEKV